MFMNEPIGLQQSQLLQILQAIPEAAAVYSDADLTIAFANEGMLRLWGKDRDVSGSTFETVLPEMTGQPFIGLLKNVWLTGKTYKAKDMPADILVDGRLQTFCFDFTYRPLLDEQGQTYAILHTAIEVSDRLALRNADRRLQQLVASSTVGMCIIDGDDLVIETANEQMLVIWGRSREQVIGKKLMEVFPDLEGQPFPQLLRDVLETGRSVIIKETPADIASTDGTPRTIYIDLGYEPLSDASGKVTSILATVTDITKEVESRKLLEASEELLKDLNEELAATNEEYITSNEELSALNEEYTAVNEELKSANEQLDEIGQQLKAANFKLSTANSGLRLENEVLMASEAKALALFADAPVAIGLLAGRELTVESANRILLELWGKTSAVVGLPLAQALPELEGQPFLGILAEVLTTGVPFYGNEIKATVEKNGELVTSYFNFVYQPVKEENGDTVSIMVVATEVTTQVEARQSVADINGRLGLALEAGQLGSYELDVNSGLMVCSEQCKKNFGLQPEDEFHFPDLIEAILPEYRAYVEEQVNAALKNDTVYMAEYQISWPDGTRHWIMASGRPRYDADGSPLKMVGVTQNITERKDFEQRKDDFLSIASHELKTPITSLKANLQLLDRLKDKPDNPIFPKLIETSNRSMSKITALVDDLLNINRFSEGKLQLQKTWFSIWEMLNVCCNHVRVDQKHELIVEGDKNLQIFADEHRVDQVVVNFVNNAVKYAPNSRQIWMIIDDQGSEVKISVKDKGPGIPADQVPHLFDRYWRADHSGKHYTGLGLGLFICAEIIKRHGGRIGAESVIGEGSTFWFTIPQNQQL